ncbi:NUDIX domain-containing protein [Nocardioides sp. zg-536]|uniref:NUDIX domain-containing protein n=1 Tax=Nocardioides faecalis TaxID=2803858 RepID=A0A938Y1D6_9ACTN|nr:NUDIX domain-containing protein [Nocardioides faecalis]MBM9460382.1 NUDIX domain-containing protein [Nocardioides faecalis]MBS4751307.1 NUDIX domain-containing protein [Nocardioides faecalis]QVI59791.1 NUDIX domain-containing protein [Nocardioides faecalis]
MSDPSVSHSTVDDGTARLTWTSDLTDRGWRSAVDIVRRQAAAALVDHDRVEVKVATDDEEGQRIATWAGLQREGVQRGRTGDVVVYARLADDVPVHEPAGFRSLLNAFLPRKRGIAQMLVRDDTPGPEPRVLMCNLTYKSDWDLPGGVVEVGESPRLAVSRELEEELQLRITAGGLVLTDWMPPWGGWDDALCLVFDGGAHPEALADQVVPQAREIIAAQFLTLSEIDERATDFTARRVRAALASLAGTGPSYTESGR